MIQLFCLMVFKIFLVIALMLFNLFDSISQDNNSILTNVDIQIEATAAINKMYNFEFEDAEKEFNWLVQEYSCLLYTSPSPRDPKTSRMPSSA